MKPSGSALRLGTVAIGSRRRYSRAMSIRFCLKSRRGRDVRQESSRLIRLFEPLRAAPIDHDPPPGASGRAPAASVLHPRCLAEMHLLRRPHP